MRGPNPGTRDSAGAEGPASNRRTETPTSDNRAATTLPEDPAPTAQKVLDFIYNILEMLLFSTLVN